MKPTNPKTTDQIRNSFITYFTTNGHEFVESSPLIPADDPSLLFTNAGMVQFKNVFLGKETRPYNRAVTCQRCVRAGGKHNDLANVGYTTRHHTFFEMLGNFSFGDYFKREAIHYAWDFLTNVLAIPAERLWVTVHKNDIETETLWREEFKASGKNPQGLGRCSDKDNFWSMGETGPCGYCSEIFYDHGVLLAGNPPDQDDQDTKDRYVEIWNLVFMQFNRDKGGALTPLPKTSVDTGMGLERIAATMQGKCDNYANDIFSSLIENAESALATGETNNNLYRAKRILADHLRAGVYLIADGLSPSNEGRGYVLRGIIRRAIYSLYKARAYVNNQPIFPLLDSVFKEIGQAGNLAYPELRLLEKLPQIKKIIFAEEKSFLETLERGNKILEQELDKLKTKVIPGAVAFHLHDTYGFPITLTTEIAKERELAIDEPGFEIAMTEQRERSRKASKFNLHHDFKLDMEANTEFLGYQQSMIKDAKIIGLYKTDGAPVNCLNAKDEGIIVLDKTPFYAEAGGEVGETGEIMAGSSAIFIVTDTKKQGPIYLHYGKAAQITTKNQLVTAVANEELRQATKCNHSATHLLHKALQETVTERALQRGSLVAPERLRFDYTHTMPLTKLEIKKIENIVNAKIRANLTVTTETTTLEKARQSGVTALFGEKYAHEVRVVKIGEFSQELCGGLHVKQTGEIGLFKIISDSAIAAGVRRIEAATSENALTMVNKIETVLEQATEILQTNSDQLLSKLNQVLTDKSLLSKDYAKLQNEIATTRSQKLMQQHSLIGDIKLIVQKIPDVDNKYLRILADLIKPQLTRGVVFLASQQNGKIQMVASITKNMTPQFSAKELLQFIAPKINGTGGGNHEMAQGGGTDLKNLDQALASIADWIKAKLAH